jgi:hypothetical protein
MLKKRVIRRKRKAGLRRKHRAVAGTRTSRPVVRGAAGRDLAER